MIDCLVKYRLQGAYRRNIRLILPCLPPIGSTVIFETHEDDETYYGEVERIIFDSAISIKEINGLAVTIILTNVKNSQALKYEEWTNNGLTYPTSHDRKNL